MKIQAKEIPMQYRPIPFWSWNEKLDPEETARQVRMMRSAGLGGYFMHARGGLQTEYMGEEWFQNVAAATEEGEKLGMRPWAYDENGWPSGFGNGTVNGLGLRYQQKYLRMEDTPTHPETQIGQAGGRWFYYEVNPFYVDTLDKEVIAEFIRSSYEPYYQRFGSRVEGFFTDEPQVSRKGIPWSFVLEDAYREKYGEELLPRLHELFLEEGDYKISRIRFWKLVTDLFSDAYMKQIYDWCDAHGMKLTGHLVLEDDLYYQIMSNGACMPHYEYFHIPGMDWLGRRIDNGLTARQVSSVAEQLGKETVLAEDYACCGHNVSLSELKGIYEWQMVRGVNLLCPHLEGYTMRGIRKRDHPPAMYYQQPWWSEYPKWVEAMSRTGMLLAQGEKKVDVLLLHPITTAWAHHSDEMYIYQLYLRFLATLRTLEEKHIQFHLGDETMLERHGSIENGKLKIGKQTYSCVIDSLCEDLLPTTKALLSEYKAQGGKLATAEELGEVRVISEPSITYTVRYFDDCKVHYFVNSSEDAKEAKLYVTGKKLDPYTGETEPLTESYRFEPWGSLLVIDDGSPLLPAEKETLLKMEGSFRIVEGTLNALTLDHCDYWFDGELQEENGFVLNICERANALERPVQIRQVYHVDMKAVPETLYLVTETPEKFTILVNGQEVDKTDCGWFADRSFRKLDIAKYVTAGENTVTFTCDFAQQPQTYENLRKSWLFESEKNKLTYDMEIEPIYLLGDFSVETEGAWELLEGNAMRCPGGFVLTGPKETVTLTDIQMQGFPFFCGEMTLEGELEVQGEHPVLELAVCGINAVRVQIGQIDRTVLTQDRLPLTGVPAGVHRIRLTLVNNLRNLLGPHHLNCGESGYVWPGNFYKERCVWSPGQPETNWNGGYCFVRMGLKD